MVDDEQAAIGISAYARHRGCSATAVHKAIRAGRLRGSVVRVQGRTMLRSAAAADREWEARTDRTRRPEYARPPAADADAAGDEPPADEPPAAAPDDADLIAPPVASDPVLADYQREAMRERARKLKMENDLREGRLVEVERATAAAFEFARVVRENVFNVSSRLSAEFAAESDAGRIRALLDAALREALESTANRMETPNGGDVSTKTADNQERGE